MKRKFIQWKSTILLIATRRTTTSPYTQSQSKSVVHPHLCIIFRVREWLFFNANSAIFHLYHDQNKLIFNEMGMRSAFYETNTLSWIFIVHVNWNNGLRIGMSTHPVTLSWFRANQSLVWPNRHSSPLSTTLQMSTLTITPLMRLYNFDVVESVLVLNMHDMFAADIKQAIYTLWFATCLLFSPGTNKIDHYDMTELLLKVTLNLIILTPILSGFSRTRGGHAENYVIKKIISER